MCKYFIYKLTYFNEGALSFKKMTELKAKFEHGFEELLVNGYIKQIQSFLSNNLIIPVGIIQLIIAYYTNTFKIFLYIHPKHNHFFHKIKIYSIQIFK